MEGIKDSPTDKLDTESISTSSKTEVVPKFIQICRVCLCETNDHMLDAPIIFFEEDINTRSLLRECTSLEIIEQDLLPNRICDKCLRILRNWHKFRLQAKRTEDILQKYLKSLSDNKSFPNAELVIHMEGETMNVVPQENISQHEDFQISVIKDKPEVVKFVFHCDSCKMTFTNQVDLDKHKEEHLISKGKPFKCPYCTKSFSFRNGYYNHLELYHSRGTNQFKCTACEKTFKYGPDLQKHKSEKCVPLTLIQKCTIHPISLEEVTVAAENTLRDTILTCSLCQKSFEGNNAFVAHYSEHSNEEKCIACGKQFPTVKLLEKHVRMHFGTRAFTCPICASDFYTPHEFRVHMSDHVINEMIYKCNMCKKRYFSVKEFEKHIVRHWQYKRRVHGTTNDGENMDIENVTADDGDSENEIDPQDSVASIKEEIDDTQMNYPVEPVDSKEGLLDVKTELVENESFEGSNETPLIKNEEEPNDCDMPEVKTAMPELDGFCEEPEQNEEENESDESDEEKPVTKKQSGEKSTERLNNLCKITCHVTGCETVCPSFKDVLGHFTKVHLSDTSPYQCSECSQTFENKMLIRLHIKKHYIFKCPICLRIKSSWSELNKHVNHTHSVERPYKCSKCDKAFVRARGLKDHETTHRDKKDFVCNICSKSFYSYNGLYLHTKGHSVITELQCPTCGKQLASKSRLKRHTNGCGKSRKKCK